jgi:glycosyltransferase involved in cell wall biosynthesis
MRIAILTQYYPPEVGAAQTRLSELAKRFAERGHQVYVLAAMPSYPQGKVYPGYGGFFRREKQSGVTILRTYIYPIKSVKMIRRFANYLSFILSSLAIGAKILPKLDYLITQSPPLYLGISGFFLSRLKGARWIFNVSDLWPESLVRLGMLRKGWSLRISWWLESFCYQNAWLVAGQSRETLGSIGHRFPNVHAYHLSNGVNTDLFRPERRSPKMFRKLTHGKSCVAIYAGLHGVAQGLEQVLEAAAQLQDLDGFCIVFVGDGPEKKRLAEQMQKLKLKNVLFLDPYPHDAIPNLLASADIGLVPLKYQLPGAVPSKIYEAMGVGLPVVLVADGEAADVVLQAQAGVVVSPGDVDNLARALRSLVQDKQKRRQLGAYGRKAAVNCYNRQTINDGFIKFLETHL